MRVAYVRRDFYVAIEEQMKRIVETVPNVKHIHADSPNDDLTVYIGEWNKEDEANENESDEDVPDPVG